MRKRPKKCTHPDCFACPYSDCLFDQLTMDEYLESEKRDKEYGEPKALKAYKQRSYDCEGRKEYFRKWYQKNREQHLRVSKEYRKRTGFKCNKDRSEYYKEYYQKHREEKIKRSIERNKRVREALNATG